ncbi:MAG: helix-turn-helix transcriptional regulator [Bryobacterales bacterium]|nr:helix-turn-helix transcriptional regulator [Bryobacterales bacterium]
MRSQHEILMENPEFRREFAVETFILECTEVLSRVMDEERITKAELSQRLGKSRAWATQVLSGSRNLTARTLAEIAYELGIELQVSSRPVAEREESSSWRPMGSMKVPQSERPRRSKVLGFPYRSAISAESDDPDCENADELTLGRQVA